MTSTSMKGEGTRTPLQESAEQLFGYLPSWVQPCGEFIQVGKQPHKCPVCDGRGYVAPGFYSGPCTSATTEQCRSCEGKGVVWG